MHSVLIVFPEMRVDFFFHVNYDDSLSSIYFPDPHHHHHNHDYVGMVYKTHLRVLLLPHGQAMDMVQHHGF